MSCNQMTMICRCYNLKMRKIEIRSSLSRQTFLHSIRARKSQRRRQRRRKRRRSREHVSYDRLSQRKRERDDGARRVGSKLSGNRQRRRRHKSITRHTKIEKTKSERNKKKHSKHSKPSWKSNFDTLSASAPSYPIAESICKKSTCHR